MGLSERGYTSRDIAFLFHPGNDPAQPLIEVLPSAWPKLRPLPHFQLLVRSRDETNQAHSKNLPSSSAAVHTSSNGSSNHANGPQTSRTVRPQPSILTNSGKSKKSRDSEGNGTASNTESSRASLRVDIESWRRNQVGHPYQNSNLVAHQQSHVQLPQHGESQSCLSRCRYKLR